MIKSQKSIHTRIVLGGLMFLIFSIIGSSFPAFAASSCTLEFKDGTVLSDVQSALFMVGEYSVRWADGRQSSTNYKGSPDDIVKVNNAKLTYNGDFTGVFLTIFRCDKFSNGKYFAFECVSGYTEGNIITDKNGGEYYDVCTDDTTYRQRSATAQSTGNCKNVVNQKECGGNYFVCNTDADCQDVKYLPKNATQGHCVSAGRKNYKVCTATKCSGEMTPVNGYCGKAGSNVAASQNGNSGDATANEQQKNAENNAPVQASDELKNAIASVDKLFMSMDTSVWKDAQGNFNTARLVSDSVAGVVLGTAGGLITSNVVKKNQIKKGFENIKCTIGGQEVGSYGDEINVNLK